MNFNTGDEICKEQTEKWVKYPNQRKKDLIVDIKLMAGFENDIVVLFGNQKENWGAEGTVSLDNCMRATACLIIVEPPCCLKCFGNCK